MTTRRSRFFPGLAAAMADQWGGKAHTAQGCKSMTQPTPTLADLDATPRKAWLQDRRAKLVAAKASPENAAKYEALARRAETGEFDDYGDAHPCGPTALHGELIAAGFTKFAARVAHGEFDASPEESEAWARSQTDPKIIAMMEAMGIGPDRSKDQ
jgi:hypothetical protein